MVPEWLLYSPVSAGAIRLFATLHRHEGERGIYPSRRRLAGLLDCSVDTVDRQTKELTAVGAVSVEPRFSDRGDRTSNLYRLHMVRPPGRTVAPTGGSKSSSTGDRRNAAQTKEDLNESSLERDLEEPSPKRVTKDFIEEMKREFPTLDVDEEWANASNHIAYKKRIDKRRYFRTWLTKALEIQKGGKRNAKRRRDIGEAWALPGVISGE